MINPWWLELPISQTNVHGPKDVRDIDVRLYEGVSTNNQLIPFPMDRDGHDFHALFQYMFYTLVQNCTRIESFFNKILNVKHGK